MDCFNCATAKRRVELALLDAGVAPAEIAEQVATIRCTMCSEAERHQAKRQTSA